MRPPNVLFGLSASLLLLGHEFNASDSRDSFVKAHFELRGGLAFRLVFGFRLWFPHSASPEVDI